MARTQIATGERAGDASKIAWNEFEKYLIQAGLSGTDIEQSSFDIATAMMVAMRLKQAEQAHDPIIRLEPLPHDWIELWSPSCCQAVLGRAHWDPDSQIITVEPGLDRWQTTGYETSTAWQAFDWQHQLLIRPEAVYMRRVQTQLSAIWSYDLALNANWTYLSACHRVRRDAQSGLRAQWRHRDGTWRTWSQASADSVEDSIGLERLTFTYGEEGGRATLRTPRGRPISSVEPDLDSDWQHVLPGLRVRLIEGTLGLDSRPYACQVWRATSQSNPQFIGDSSYGRWIEGPEFEATNHWTVLDDDNHYWCRLAPDQAPGTSAQLEFRLNSPFG